MKKKAKVIKANTKNWDNDWDKINAKRAEIKAIKEKKRLAKLEQENELKLRNKKKKDTDKKFKNAHDQNAKVIKANSKNWDNDWDKINAKRAEIKAIKEKKRLAKLEKENELKKRNSTRTDKIYNDPHSKTNKVIKAKERVGNDWDKIEKQRAEIKALKEKKRRLKAEKEAAEAEQQSVRSRAKSNSKKKKKTKVTTKKKKKKAESSSDDEEVVSSTNETVFGDMHEKNNKVIKANTKNWDNDWDKINAKRAEIKRIKEKKRLEKLEKENELKKRNSKRTDKIYNNPHSKTNKVIKAKERVGNDWDKIEKQRAEIKALKEKKRRQKAEKEAAEAEAQSVRSRARSASNSKKKKTKITKKTKKKKKAESSSDDEEVISSAHETTFGNMHEKNNKVIKANTKNWDNDWDKINAKRAEIKAIKEKKRLAKLDKENELKQRNKKKKDTDKKFKNAHDQNAKVIKANTKNWDNDWDKINAKRAEIKKIKEKKRLAKLEKESELKQRNKKKKETDKKFKNAHDQNAKVIKANTKNWDNDWDKIQKQRAEIKRIKDKRRLEKETGIKSPKTVKHTYGNAHEQ